MNNINEKFRASLYDDVHIVLFRNISVSLDSKIENNIRWVLDNNVGFKLTNFLQQIANQKEVVDEQYTPEV